MSLSLKTAQATDPAAAKTNMVYLNPKDASKLENAPGKTVAPGTAYVEIGKYVFSFQYVHLLWSVKVLQIKSEKNSLISVSLALSF